MARDRRQILGYSQGAGNKNKRSATNPNRYRKLPMMKPSTAGTSLVLNKTAAISPGTKPVAIVAKHQKKKSLPCFLAINRGLPINAARRTINSDMLEATTIDVRWPLILDF
jgi:hypothetical protein